MLWRKKKRKITPAENRKLEEFGMIYMELVGTIGKKMKEKTTEEIMDIIDIVNRLEKKNCWFAVYRIKEFIRFTGKMVLKERTPKLDIKEIMEQRHATEDDIEKEEEKETKEEDKEIETEEQFSS